MTNPKQKAQHFHNQAAVYAVEALWWRNCDTEMAEHHAQVAAYFSDAATNAEWCAGVSVFPGVMS